ncbi:MAG: GTPase domain-containing protein [bacterium]
MSFINDKTKEINCKIVYYGPPLSGKSTTLRQLYGEVRKGSKGDMISLSQDSDRTLYFDFVPLNLGKVGSYTMRLHLYTVPGEVGYDQSRSLISKGVDGVVFIADSQLTRMEANLAALAGLREILRKEGHEWAKTPCVFQYNKRDLPGAVPTRDLAHFLNEEGREEFETVAITGKGVFDAFKAITQQVLLDLKKQPV